MQESAMGAVVPSVKSEQRPSSAGGPSDAVAAAAAGPATTVGSANEETAAKTADPGVFELDKDFLCPICMQIIKDAFLTACGHSFCYMCIVTHLRNKNDCPCCGHYLTVNQLFPNFLLDKVTTLALRVLHS